MKYVLGPYREWFLLFILVLIIAEAIWVYRKRRQNFNLKESLANTFILVGYVASKALTIGYQLAVLGFLRALLFFICQKTDGYSRLLLWLRTFAITGII